jgi:3-hydroxybutyryl-CoA dehydrogenase
MEGRLRAGLLGRKTQEGFYKYVDGKPVYLSNQLPDKEIVSTFPVWVSSDETSESKIIIDYLTKNNIKFEKSENQAELYHKK